MALSPALWSDPPFPASPIHDLMSFPLEKCLVSYHEFSDRSSCCDRDSPPPPSWHHECLSLLVPSPTLSSLMCVTLSCEHLHKFPIRAGTDSASHCIRVTGKGEQGILVPSTGCWSQFSWVLFQTLEIFIKSSQIFWVFHFGYTLDRSKLKTVVYNQNHIL